MSKKTFKINKPIGQWKVGQLAPVKVHEDGTPVERYWRDRLADSKIDGCISIVDDAEQSAIEQVASIEVQLASLIEGLDEAEQKDKLKDFGMEKFNLSVSKSKSVENMVASIVEASNQTQQQE